MPTRRYPLVPVLATILKVLAALLLLFFLYQAVLGFMETVRSWTQGQPSPFGGGAPPVSGTGERLVSLLRPLSNLLFGLLIPVLIWGAADLLQAFRDIEFNTRVHAGLAHTHETPATAIEPIDETGPSAA